MQHNSTSPHVGSSMACFLRKQSMRDEAEVLALKRVLAVRVAELMQNEGLSKAGMARRLHVGIPALSRFLDPRNDALNLYMLQRVATGMGQKLRITLVDRDDEAQS